MAKPDSDPAISVAPPLTAFDEDRHGGVELAADAVGAPTRHTPSPASRQLTSSVIAGTSGMSRSMTRSSVGGVHVRRVHDPVEPRLDGVGDRLT